MKKEQKNKNDKAADNLNVPFKGAPAQRIQRMRFTQNNFLNI